MEPNEKKSEKEEGTGAGSLRPPRIVRSYSSGVYEIVVEPELPPPPTAALAV